MVQICPSFVDVWAKTEGAWNSIPDSVRTKMQYGAGRLCYTWLQPWDVASTLDDPKQLRLPTLLIKASETITSLHRVCELISQAIPQCPYAEIDGAGRMCG